MSRVLRIISAPRANCQFSISLCLRFHPERLIFRFHILIVRPVGNDVLAADIVGYGSGYIVDLIQ